MSKNIQKALLESIIPIIGFFYWHWGLDFILYFYLIDFFVKEIIAHFGANKIDATQGNAVLDWKNYGAFSFLSLLLGSLLWIQLLHFRDKNFDLLDSFKAFLLYEEWNVPQWVILLPIIVLSVWMSYKFEFLAQKKHFSLLMRSHWKNQILSHLGFFAASLIAMVFIPLKPLVTLVLLALTPVAVEIIKEKKLSQNKTGRI